MIDFDLEYLEEELDDISLVLALKMVELRLYYDISSTEDDINSLDDKSDLNSKGKVFLSKIKWFREWIDMKNNNLLNAGLTELDEMCFDDILNAVMVNDSAGFKRKKIYKEVTGMPIYMINEEAVCTEDMYANEYYSEEMKSRLMIK